LPLLFFQRKTVPGPLLLWMLCYSICSYPFLLWKYHLDLAKGCLSFQREIFIVNWQMLCCMINFSFLLIASVLSEWQKYEDEHCKAHSVLLLILFLFSQLRQRVHWVAMQTVPILQNARTSSLRESRSPVAHIAKMVVAMITGYLVAWLPYAFFSLYNVANTESPVRKKSSRHYFCL